MSSKVTGLSLVLVQSPGVATISVWQLPLPACASLTTLIAVPEHDVAKTTDEINRSASLMGHTSEIDVVNPPSAVVGTRLPPPPT